MNGGHGYPPTRCHKTNIRHGFWRQGAMVDSRWCHWRSSPGSAGEVGGGGGGTVVVAGGDYLSFGFLLFWFLIYIRKLKQWKAKN